MRDDCSIDIIDDRAEYVNTARIGYTAFDISLELGRQGLFDMPGTVKIQMSPEFTKLLAEILNQTVQRFEEAYGKVRDIEEVSVSDPVMSTGKVN